MPVEAGVAEREAHGVRQFALHVDGVLLHARCALVRIDEADFTAGAGQQSERIAASAGRGRSGTGCQSSSSGSSPPSAG